jgi:S-disulfanyl-L-cysteine oxidoreductase SoxD
MRSIPFERIAAVTALTFGFACGIAFAQSSKLPYSSIGTTPTKQDTGNLAWAAGRFGRDLPPGSGTAQQGYPIFIGRCSMCHGTNAQGVNWPVKFSPIGGPRLGGGTCKETFELSPPGCIRTLAYTIAPFPELIFDTIAVEMPMYHPGTLTPDQVYALTAFILYKNKLIDEDQVMNRETLPKVKMPNRNSFPKTDAPYMNMDKRGCYKTYGDCMGE